MLGAPALVEGEPRVPLVLDRDMAGVRGLLSAVGEPGAAALVAILARWFSDDTERTRRYNVEPG